MPRIIASALAAMVLMTTAVGVTSPSPAWAYSDVGEVTHVADGDTFDVDVPGDGQGAYRVRITGIQAPEIGECGAAEATTRLEQLIDGEDVTLLADDEGSMSILNRKLRFVELGGVDIGLQLIEEGLAFAFPSDVEPSRNDEYLAAAAEAADQGIGVWDTNRCGNGPKQNNDLSLTVKWDADGDDTSNLNGEWIRINNDTGSSVSLNGWSIRDSALNILNFPSGTTIPANGSVKVHIGSGSNTSTKVYWGLSEPILDNTVGDTVVLVDPDGDFRAWFQYPCVADCHSPLAGKLSLSANFDAQGSDSSNPNGEWVNVANISASTVDVSGYLLESWPYSYEFPSGSTLSPGERLRVHIGSGTNTSSKQYWGFSSGILTNSGDEVKIKSFDDVVAASQDWPCNPCSEILDVEIASVQYNAPGNDATNPNGEFVVIKNEGDATVDLRDWKVVSAPYHYDFSTSLELDPGDSMTLYVGSGSNSSTKRYWGKSSGILGNSGDKVELLNPTRDRVDCADWGSYNCGSLATGSPFSALEMHVHYNAPGNDVTNPNGEWITLVNTGGSNIDLSSSALISPPYHFSFAPDTVLGSGDYVRVFIGSGTKTSTKQYWGRPKGILNNGGDQVTLTQAGGQPAITYGWPCNPCGPIGSLIISTVHYNAPGNDMTNPNGEYIVIKNVGGSTVDLMDWTVINDSYQISSKISRLVAPGGTVKIYIGSGSNTSSKLYWGKSHGILGNGGDEVILKTPFRDVASCYSWGTGSC